MKVKDWLKANSSNFSECDLRYLVQSVFGKSKVLIEADDELMDEEKKQYLDKIKKDYEKGQPLAYLLGKEEFFGLEFKVNPNVLIPRKETELIVERAVHIIKDNGLKDILDLGVGSGIISICIKKVLPDAVSVTASDISRQALEVAKENARLHDVSINFVESDLFSSFKKDQFDAIVTNPPYVDPSMIKGTLKTEPRGALAADENGFSVIHEILQKALFYLRKDGYIIIELGYNHRRMIEEFVNSNPGYKIIEWIADYAGHNRGVVLKRI
jgi:release factor glutamine methyltransferase